VYEYAQAVENNADSSKYRMKLFAARNRAALKHLGMARDLRDKGQLQEALVEFNQAYALDPSLETASQEMTEVREILRADELVAEGEKFIQQRRLVQAKNALDGALLLSPGHAKAHELLTQIKRLNMTVIEGFELDTASSAPITLKFKDARVKDVFKILARLSGINFIFDEGVDAKKVTIMLEDATFSQALELLLKMNELSMRVLNPKTVILYPKTKDKEKQYEDQVIQSFYLSNIDAKKAVNLLRTMLQLRKIYVHEELNALVIRDNAQTIKLAQQILEAADRGDAEVIFDLELVAVSNSDSQQIGAKFSSYGVQVGMAKPGGNIVSDSLSAGGPTDGLIKSLNNLQTFFTLPTAAFDFAKTLSSAETLANPKLRVKNKGKAKIHVGTREPIVTTTTGTDGQITSTNIQYVDVGTKLDVEPTIQLDDSVVTKLSLEVSQVLERIQVGNNEALQIQTTNAQTELSLKDGERTVLGGLLQDNSSRTKTTFPFLGDIPLLGDLVSNHDHNDQKREILLSITPHIVKQLNLPKADIATIWSGGEDDLKAGPTLSSFAEAIDAEQNKQPPAVTPAVIRDDEANLTPIPVEPGESAPSVIPPPRLAPQRPSPPVVTPPVIGEPPVAPEPGGEPPVQLPPAEPVTEEAIPPGGIEPQAANSRAFLSGPSLVDVGQEFTLTVQIDELDRLFSAPLFIKYDQDLLTFVRIDEGNFLRSDGSQTVLTSSPNPAQGRIIVGYKQAAGGNGASGSGDLYQLVFVAKAPGKAVVNLDRVNFRDPEGNRLPVTVEGTVVEVR